MPVSIRGKQYSTVAERVDALHGDMKGAVSIETSIVDSIESVDFSRLRQQLQIGGFDKNAANAVIDLVKRQEVICRAEITFHTEKGERRFSGLAHEIQDLTNSNKVNFASYIENASTSAIGRALAAAGYAGTEFASADEMKDALNKGKASKDDENHLKTIRGLKAELKAAEADIQALKQRLLDQERGDSPPEDESPPNAEADSQMKSRQNEIVKIAMDHTDGDKAMAIEFFKRQAKETLGRDVEGTTDIVSADELAQVKNALELNIAGRKLVRNGLSKHFEGQTQVVKETFEKLCKKLNLNFAHSKYFTLSEINELARASDKLIKAG